MLEDISRPYLAGEIEFCCKFLHKLGIPSGSLSPQAMVKVGDDQIPIPSIKQEMQQGHRVRPTGNRHNQLLLFPWKGS